jgi:hypothetical protein
MGSAKVYLLNLSLFEAAPEKDQKKKPKIVFDTVSITPVVSGPPFGGMVCLQECRDDVVECSCESAR